MPAAAPFKPRYTFPPPTTIATSTPRLATAWRALAIAAMRPGSAPYSRSPMSASPDSFRRTRRNAGCPFCDSVLLLPDLEADEAPDDDVLARCGGDLGPELLDRPGLVLLLVHVLLVEQHDLLEPLAHAALGDPLLHILGLAVGGRLLPEDPHLALAVLVRDVLLGHVQRGGRGYVQGHLAGERLELVATSHEIGLGVDFHEHADLSAGVHVARDDALRGRLAPPLRGLGVTLDPEDLLGLVEVPLGLFEGVPNVHDPGARAFSKRLDVLGRCHQLSSSGSKVRRSRGAAAAGAGVAGSSGEKPASSASRLARSSASRRSCSSASRRARSSSRRKRADFSATSPAIASMISLQERMASSFPGITKSTGSGSQLVSTRPMIGIFSRAASRRAIASVLRSTTNTASGTRCMSRTPPRLTSSLSRSPSAAIRSRVGSSSSVPLSVQSLSSCSRLIRLEIVWK